MKKPICSGFEPGRWSVTIQLSYEDHYAAIPWLFSSWNFAYRQSLLKAYLYQLRIPLSCWKVRDSNQWPLHLLVHSIQDTNQDCFAENVILIYKDRFLLSTFCLIRLYCLPCYNDWLCSVWPDDQIVLSIFGHFQQWKFAPKHTNCTKVSWKLCPKPYKP